MKNKTEIHWLSYERIPSNFVERFTIRQFKWEWAGRLARWALSKLGIISQEPTSFKTVYQHHFNGEDFMRSIFDQRAQLQLDLFEPSYIFLGPEDYENICRAKAPWEPFGIEIKQEDIYVDRIECVREYRKLADMEAVLIPQMSGILVVPKWRVFGSVTSKTLIARKRILR